MSPIEIIQQTIKKHPVKWSIAGFLFITLPQWLSGTWALFCSTPLFQWLQSKGIKMPSFSLSWITVPVGFLLLGYVAWQSYVQRKQAKPLPGLLEEMRQHKTDEEKKEVIEKIARRNFPERFESDLEIEPVPSENVAAKKHPLHIRILNNNPKQNADDLKVEIISFSDNLSMQFQSVAQRYYHPSHFDKIAELKSATGRNTINPRDGLEFTVFYFESPIRIQGQPRSIIATFDLKGGIAKENVAHFHEGKKYPIKFAASARGFAKIEREFNVKFFDDDGICKVVLTPYAPPTKEEKRSEILQELGHFQDQLNDRYSKIKQMEFWEYAKLNDGYAFENNLLDGETTMMISDIERFLDREIPGESADFKDTVNMQFTPIPNYDPNGLGEEKRKYYVLALDRIKHHANQLAKIKDKFSARPT
jgi:hypothetical protein